MFKRFATAVISAVLLLSVSCSAANEIKSVEYKEPNSPKNMYEKRFRVVLADQIGDRVLYMARYSENGRFLGFETFYADDKKLYSDESEISFNFEVEQLPMRVRFFMWSGLNSVKPVSNAAEVEVLSINGLFKRDLPDFLTDVYSDDGRAAFRTANERDIRDIMVDVGNKILAEVDSVDMTKEYLQTRFKTEIAEVKNIYYNSMTTTEQGNFQDRFASFTNIKNGKYVELRVYLMQIFGLI